MFRTAIPAVAALVTAIIMVQPAYATGDHEGGHDVVPAIETPEEHHGAEPGHHGKPDIEALREEHAGHEHGHDFEAIAALSPEDMALLHDAMTDLGLTMPPMDPTRGRALFVVKGCIACHQVNGVGGEVGPSLDAADMPVPMNTFEFAARMWRGAAAMIEIQEDLFGAQIELTGQDLADLIAFAHDEAEQQELSDADIPKRFRELIGN